MLLTGYESATAEYGFCADQPKSLRVRIGGSVTIPCIFSYPRTLDPVKVSVYWKAGSGEGCGSASNIYNPTEKYTHRNYTNRITLVGDPEARSATIRIDNLRESDGDQKYCCRVHITLQNNINNTWQNRHMTNLEFIDTPKQYYVHQPNVFLALVGTSVTIPCISSYPNGLDPVMEFSVTWKAGLKDLCTKIKDNVIDNGTTIHKNYKGRVKLVGDATGNNASSLHIEKLEVWDSKRYCCFLNSTKDLKLSLRAHTDLIVGDLMPIAGYSVVQVKRTEAQVEENITMSCTITHPDDWHLVGIEIYWRFGREWGKFAFHPNEESIHPEYRGRTRLTGGPRQRSPASLEITHVTEVDSETYYCLVVFRFCNGNNTFKSVLHQGEGTLLLVKDTGPLYTIMWIVAVIFLLTISILLVVLQKKGLILKCSKAREIQPPSGNRTSLDAPAAHQADSQNAAYAVVSKSNKRNKGEESIVYASLELETRTEVEPSPKSGPNNDIVYSAVKFK